MTQGMVISLEMRIIIEMAHRGSKSDIDVYVSVKEQRVDGIKYIFYIFKVYSSSLERGLHLKKDRIL